MLKRAFLATLFTAAVAHAAVVRLRSQGTFRRSRWQNLRHRRRLRAHRRESLFRHQSQAPRESSHRRHRQGSAQPGWPRGIFIRRLPPAPQRPQEGQRHRALRSLQSRLQKYVDLLQPRRRFARPAQRRRIRRRPADESGLHAAVGRLAVRHAGRTEPGVSLSAHRAGRARHRARRIHARSQGSPLQRGRPQSQTLRSSESRRPESHASPCAIKSKARAPPSRAPTGTSKTAPLSCPKNGVEPGRIYELVYTSENPPVAGTGFAAVRDMISWLRYGGFVAGAPRPTSP